MTHREFSRNASSSRAIPVKKLVALALEDPAFFLHIGKNKPGMQANEQVDAETRAKFEVEWRELCKLNSEYALRWANDYNIHKQVVNRVMEPWHHITVLVSSTSFVNWDKLRMHPDAMPEIQELAALMYLARSASTPTSLDRGQWHLPFVSNEERLILPIETQVKCSSARCARTSYKTHEGTVPNILDDEALHDKLVVSDPRHASPTEHQATPMGFVRTAFPGWRRSNFKGFTQYRKFLEFGRPLQ